MIKRIAPRENQQTPDSATVGCDLRKFYALWVFQSACSRDYGRAIQKLAYAFFV